LTGTQSARGVKLTIIEAIRRPDLRVLTDGSENGRIELARAL
jgi:hypothetical protein